PRRQLRAEVVRPRSDGGPGWFARFHDRSVGDRVAGTSDGAGSSRGLFFNPPARTQGRGGGMAYAADLNSAAERHRGSNPLPGTTHTSIDGWPSSGRQETHLRRIV